MNRREFIKAGAGLLAVSGCRGLFCERERAGFSLAMAGITLVKFKTDAALDFCERHGFRALCVKDFHLPFEATASEIAAFRRKCADRGITPYAAGPIYITSADEAKRRFDYAAALGVDLVVGVPCVKKDKGWLGMFGDRALCELCAKLADEYRMRFAIHNHGQNATADGNPNLYPTVPAIDEIIRDLGPRMGFCVDWAYTYADGFDCERIARTYADRIFDGHVRCISNPRNGASGVNPAQRVFDYGGIFAALGACGYSGRLGLELANAFPDNPQWIDESRDYFNGLI